MITGGDPGRILARYSEDPRRIPRGSYEDPTRIRRCVEEYHRII